MPTRTTADILCLGSLLGSGLHFRIPSYQRPYAWTTREAGQLLDDINLAREQATDRPATEGGYFLATVLLMDETEPPDTAPHRDIVDGQQRLVTLTILLAVLRDLADDRGLDLASDIEDLLYSGWSSTGTAQPRIVIAGHDRAFFERWVLEPGSAHDIPLDDDLTPAEQRMLEVREHFVSELSSIASDDLERFVDYVRRSCFFSVVTTRGIDRAHRMFTHLNYRGRSLARNDILKAHILENVSPERRGELTARWTAIEQRLGERFEELFSHIRTIAGRRRDRVITGIEELVARTGSTEAFFETTLEPYADILCAITAGEAPTERSRSLLRYLDWIGSAEWLPPVMAWWHKASGDTDGLERFLARFERLAFCLRLVGIGADKRATRFNAVLAAIEAGRLDEPDSPLELTREEARNIAFNLRNLHARSQLTCKLLLLRLNEELAGSPQILDPQLYTVEHVLPQRPSRTSEWRSLFSNAEEREACTQSLGNLVLVTRGQNDRARNMELARKLDIYFDEKYGPVPHLTRELQGITTWRPADVQARQERLLAVISQIWQLDTRRSTTTSPISEEASAPLPRRPRARREKVGPPVE
jgi:Protein of unknown function DUF262/Protein of unknown function (DUF1524)